MKKKFKGGFHLWIRVDSSVRICLVVSILAIGTNTRDPKHCLDTAQWSISSACAGFNSASSVLVDAVILSFLKTGRGASNIKVGTQLEIRFNLSICKEVACKGTFKHFPDFQNGRWLLEMQWR